MRSSIRAFASLGFLATFVACRGETTEVSSTTSSFSTESSATADATVTTETMQADSTAPDAREQITDGAKMIGKGLKEEAR